MQQKELLLQQQLFEPKSNEEFYFSYYLSELQKEGYIKEWSYEPKTFRLLETVKAHYTKQLKTKEKIIEVTLLQGMTYTPDFFIEFEPIAEGIFYANKYQNPSKTLFPEKESWVDVKGTFSNFDAMRRFSVQQKLMFDKHQIYVKAIVVPTIFEKSFNPNRFYFTYKTAQIKKKTPVGIKLKQFLNGKQL